MSLWENLVHLGIGVVLVAVVSNAYLRRFGIVVVGSLFFGVLGAVDEYVFHRNLPAVESDVHAKEHLALLLFVVAFAALEWMGGSPG